jgi:hypothetical protein
LMGGGLLSRSPFEMIPGSPLLKLLKQDTFPAGIPMTSVYSKSDLVCPWWFSQLNPRPGESSMQNRLVKGIGHSQLTSHAGVYHVVKAELDRASELWRERA